jgi:hypothetical protein
MVRMYYFYYCIEISFNTLQYYLSVLRDGDGEAGLRRCKDGGDVLLLLLHRNLMRIYLTIS